ncbi:MAG TPA: RDD family protein [Acidimicrobiales bacterium]
MGGAVFERVRTTYPYPLARYARAYVTADSPRERYDAALDLGERLTILLGALGLTWARALDLGDQATRDWRRSLRRGITLGAWLWTARAVAMEASRKGHEIGGLAPALAPADTGLNVALDALLRARNRNAHGGPPRGEVDLAEALAELTPSLERALAGAEFLAATDLLLIQECRAQRYEPTFAVSALLMTGDHPDFLPVRLTSSDVFLERTLVLRSGTDAFDMMPYALVDDCRTCRRRELFYPSRLDAAEALFVSFESNHELRTEEWVRELRGDTTPTFLAHRVAQATHTTHATVTAFTAVTVPPRPGDRPTARPADRPADEPAKGPTDRPTDRPTGRPAVEHPIGTPAKRPAARAAPEPAPAPPPATARPAPPPAPAGPGPAKPAAATPTSPGTPAAPADPAAATTPPSPETPAARAGSAARANPAAPSPAAPMARPSPGALTGPTAAPFAPPARAPAAPSGRPARGPAAPPPSGPPSPRPAAPPAGLPPPPPPPATASPRRTGPARPPGRPAPSAPRTRREPSPAGRSARLLARRVLARVIDFVVSVTLLFAAIFVVGIPGGLFTAEAAESGEASMGAPADAAVFAIWIGGTLAYEIVATVRYGGTLGKKAARLRVTDRDGDRLGPGRAVGRILAAVGLLVLCPMVVLDVLWPLWDPHGDMLHDKAAGSRVVSSAPPGPSRAAAR